MFLLVKLSLIAFPETRFQLAPYIPITVTALSLMSYTKDHRINNSKWKTDHFTTAALWIRNCNGILNWKSGYSCNGIQYSLTNLHDSHEHRLVFVNENEIVSLSSTLTFFFSNFRLIEEILELYADGTGFHGLWRLCGSQCQIT